jgi:hypothetical protein
VGEGLVGEKEGLVHLAPVVEENEEENLVDEDLVEEDLFHLGVHAAKRKRTLEVLPRGDDLSLPPASADEVGDDEVHKLGQVLKWVPKIIITRAARCHPTGDRS